MLFLIIESPSVWELTTSENPSPDSRILLDICTVLRSRRSQEPYVDEGFSLENDLRVYVGDILQHLSYGAVLMLALMTWNFNASSSEASEDLITFLRPPHDSQVWGILQDRYRSIMCETVPSNFKFLFVLDWGFSGDQCKSKLWIELYLLWSTVTELSEVVTNFSKTVVQNFVRRWLFTYSYEYFECRLW